jgi:CTP synthase
MFCRVSTEQVVGVHDVSSVYHVPLLLQAQGIVDFFTKRLSLDKLGVDGRTSPSLGKSPASSEILNGLSTAINGLSLGKEVNGVARRGSEVEEQERVWEARRAKGRELGIKWRDLTTGYISFVFGCDSIFIN